MASLVLKSDVSNDLKQNADQIGSVSKALTEFVWNSVQYQPEGRRLKWRSSLRAAGRAALTRLILSTMDEA